MPTPPPAKTVVYPYIPNSAPNVKAAMLREVGGGQAVVVSKLSPTRKLVVITVYRV